MLRDYACMSLLTYKVLFLFSRDPSREALLEHVREHSRTDGAPEEPHKPPVNKKSENTPDPADLAYRCGHCNQLSNWKHVIQVHKISRHNLPVIVHILYL